MAYTVTDGRVEATTQINRGDKDDDGNDVRPRFAARDFYRGDELPDDVPDEQIDTLLRQGRIEESKTVAKKAPAKKTAAKN